ncbi:MAG TPA: hypothetical protein VGE85_06485 [Terracidiphilus sp.]|jgi:hypothetical protein
MERFRTLPVFLAFAAIALVCVPSHAQEDQNTATPQPTHVRKADRRPMPFPPGSETQAPAASLEFRAYDQMTPQDRDLAADAESAIGERAGFAGLEFNQGKWSYQQIVCPALPKHLFLQFTRNNGKGDVSVFSASIPRSGDGRVRIIPILRRGYSLFSPAPINALTISAFNHIRAEEHVDTTPEWLATGMCYAALAGAHPQIGPPEQTDIKKLPAAPTGREVIPMHGGAVIRFTDVAALPRPMQWTMTFNGKGKLLHASHTAAPKSGGKVVERTPAEVQGKPVQAADPSGKAILIK